MTGHKYKGGSIFVPYNGKIADITHADTNKHMLDLAIALGETRKIISIEIVPFRMGGTGNFYTFANEGGNSIYGFTDNVQNRHVILANGTNRLQYQLSPANDDWDLYCHGYVVEA